ncbi:MAG: hydantoinase/oxoprolinase family protein, partial [Actinobacteria bacterium]|nr:hydantoinase/oxoprolinase family protein [Actinomycetota bacterium]
AGVLTGLAKAGLSGDDCSSFRHGATVSTNAILERKGVKTGLITTDGFRDVLGGGRAERISAFELDWDPPEMIIPRENVLGIRERTGPWGDVLKPLNEDDVRDAIRKFKKRGIESIAVVYMDSFMNFAHEQRTAELIKQEWPEVDVTVSHKIRPEMLEFERTTTTVLNAYVSPILKRYLTGLEKILKDDWKYDGQILLTTCAGGIVGLEEAIAFPAKTFHSSPVSGAVGMAGYVGGLAGFDNIIAFETGGTTNNVSMIYGGSPAITHEWKILWNVPCCIPSVDTIFIGAGGGSIGWVDRGNLLNVGPQSMGAVPGPACYGQGGEEATNTDCQIVLGRIDPEYFLGGAMTVYGDLSKKALKEKIGDKYGWSAEQAAWNMYKVATSNLMMALRLQTVARGWDPRDFAIVPYGGGGALYAVDLARQLGAAHVVVPPYPGYASAFGATRVDIKHEFTHPVHKTESEISFKNLNAQFSDLEGHAREILAKEGVNPKDVQLDRYVDCKYFSQSQYFTVEIPSGPLTDLKGVMTEFLAAMKARYGYTLPQGYVELEIVNLRIIAWGKVPKPELAPIRVDADSAKTALKGRRNVYFEESNGFTLSNIYERGDLAAGATFEGPAIVEQEDTTTVIPPNAAAKVDPYGNIIVQVNK